MNVTTNLKTGSITLFMDEAFFFVNDSAVLSEEVKKKLKVIVPIYADELFKDKTNRKLITSVNVIGHSSPRFDSRYVDPLQGDSVAYNYNLALSTNRAVEIVKYIFSNEFGDFDHASIFRSLTKASGKSYSNPIPLDRRRYPANSKELGQCGKYDCRRSRRVEISFSLREDTNQILRFFK